MLLGVLKRCWILVKSMKETILVKRQKQKPPTKHVCFMTKSKLQQLFDKKRFKKETKNKINVVQKIAVQPPTRSQSPAKSGRHGEKSPRNFGEKVGVFGPSFRFFLFISVSRWFFQGFLFFCRVLGFFCSLVFLGGFFRGFYFFVGF